MPRNFVKQHEFRQTPVHRISAVASGLLTKSPVEFPRLYKIYVRQYEQRENEMPIARVSLNPLRWINVRVESESRHRHAYKDASRRTNRLWHSRQSTLSTVVATDAAAKHSLFQHRRFFLSNYDVLYDGKATIPAFSPVSAQRRWSDDSHRSPLPSLFSSSPNYAVLCGESSPPRYYPLLTKFHESITDIVLRNFYQRVMLPTNLFATHGWLRPDWLDSLLFGNWKKNHAKIDFKTCDMAFSVPISYT